MTVAATQPAVVMKAFTWAYEELGWSNAQAAEFLGISEIALAQTSLVGFDTDTPEAALQLAFIRMYHLLYAMSDGDTNEMQAWLIRYNPHLGTHPEALCSSQAGIDSINDYLESSHTSTPPPAMNFALPRRKTEKEDKYLHR